MKKALHSISLLLCLLLLVSCGTTSSEPPKTEPSSKIDSIPFTDGQLYAVAYLGYEEMSNLDFFTENYLDDPSVPIHHFSGGEYYLIIPRYPGMTLHLYRNSLNAPEPILVYETENCAPFIARCNISDIFPDVTVSLTHESQSTRFSPYISLKDGSIMVGEFGLDITHLKK